MAGEDREYSDWIRQQPCCMPGCPDSSKPSEQHHRSGAGMGLRAHDHESMPLCKDCHHVRLGQMPKEERREFEVGAIKHHRIVYYLTRGLCDDESEPGVVF